MKSGLVLLRSIVLWILKITSLPKMYEKVLKKLLGRTYDTFLNK